MLGMIISQAYLTFRVLSLRSRSLWLFLEKLCHHLLHVGVTSLAYTPDAEFLAMHAADLIFSHDFWVLC